VQTIDGCDIQPLLLGERGARSPHDAGGFYYYFMDQLQAVRSGPWKLNLPLQRKYTNLSRKTAPAKLELYDVRQDVGETQEVSARHPDVVRRLLALAEAARCDLGDLDQVGRGQRPVGWVDKPKPLVLP